MKSFKYVLAIVLLIAGFSLANALSPVTVSVSTVVPNGSVNGANAFTAAGYPNYTGNSYIRKIVVDNLNSASADRFQVWSACTSSTTATLKFSAVVAASSTVTYDFLPRVWFSSSTCVSKGSVDNNAQFKATYFLE